MISAALKREEEIHSSSYAVSLKNICGAYFELDIYDVPVKYHLYCL
jgi:hypothetical protein